jgi:hypothetical protein
MLNAAAVNYTAAGAVLLVSFAERAVPVQPGAMLQGERSCCWKHVSLQDITAN